ncbi:unnamed protein product [Spirodela intermedia]|uniref:Uncharacterized protein n=1 Tax=Spirodela intermedia TaxID=51605 RepID=A0A7I8J0Z2_SPIIN|nr:unnamed protein product [Spirodela intermedia]CAA6663885.1 unnamed protein product [Spirodela intermedia]
MSPGSSLSVRYGSQFGPHDDLVLLEVDDGLLHEILHKGVAVRGQPDEDAVLCTASATYAMKFVGTSNSVFLIPPGDGDSEIRENGMVRCEPSKSSEFPQTIASVFKVAPGNIELVPVAPRLEKLKSLLSERPYTLEEEDDYAMETENSCARSDRSGLYRWTDLVNLIQASDEELMAGLRSLSAVEIGGFWRLVAEDSIDEILKMTLNNCIIHEWQTNSMKEHEVVPMLVSDGYPHAISEDPGGPIWSLNEKPVCLHFARRALRGGKMKLEAFMEKWKSTLPQGMRADLGMLEGEVLYESLGLETWIRAFSVSGLPSTPEERFSALFQERAKWAWKDLHPYIRDLRIPGLSSEALLIKYTRRTQPTAEAEPIFSAR